MWRYAGAPAGHLRVLHRIDENAAEGRPAARLPARAAAHHGRAVRAHPPRAQRPTAASKPAPSNSPSTKRFPIPIPATLKGPRERVFPAEQPRASDHASIKKGARRPIALRGAAQHDNDCIDGPRAAKAGPRLWFHCLLTAYIKAPIVITTNRPFREWAPPAIDVALRRYASALRIGVGHRRSATDLAGAITNAVGACATKTGPATSPTRPVHSPNRSRLAPRLAGRARSLALDQLRQPPARNVVSVCKGPHLRRRSADVHRLASEIPSTPATMSSVEKSLAGPSLEFPRSPQRAPLSNTIARSQTVLGNTSSEEISPPQPPGIRPTKSTQPYGSSIPRRRPQRAVLDAGSAAVLCASTAFAPPDGHWLSVTRVVYLRPMGKTTAPPLYTEDQRDHRLAVRHRAKSPPAQWPDLSTANSRLASAPSPL